jgi:putative ABC transport system permease protein
MNDIVYALRGLARTPAFTLVALLTLALGIGANAAIFSVVNAVLLRPLPYPDPGELMALYESLPPGATDPAPRNMPLTPPTTRDWAVAGTFASVGYYAEGDFIMTGAGEPSRIPGASVSSTFFDTLRVPLAAGRPIARTDDREGQPLVCVIGHDLWKSRFGSDPSLIGSSIELSGRRHTVIGIAQPGFAFPAGAQIWVPLAIPEAEYADDQRLSFYLHGIGRLKPSVTPREAAADLNVIASRLAAQFPEQYKGRGAAVVPLHEASVNAVRPALLMLLGVAGCVLLIACVNVANLLMARGASRAGEMATRAALGASRRRMLQQLLIESLILAGAGALAGILVAMWSRDAIVALSPDSVPRISEVRIDGVVLAFTVAVAAITSIVFGLTPALWTTRRALSRPMTSSRKGTADAGSQHIRELLVVAQLALSLALLTGAGLLARTFWNLMSVNPGFNPEGVMTLEVVLPRAKYAEPERRAEFFGRVLETLEANPLVTAAGGATNLPLSNTSMTFGFYREGMTPYRDAPLSAGVRGVSAGYFQALAIPIVRGRAITHEDRLGSPPVVVINEAMRHRFWPDSDPIGQRISITRGRTVIWREIVGIVGDIRHRKLSAEPEPEIYMPYAHDPFFFLRIAVRSNAPRDVVAGIMRAAVWAEDARQPVSHVRSMNEIVGASVASERFNAVLIATFACLALVLAAVGLYGVIAWSVTTRKHEFGVRLALGAERRHLVGLVLVRTLTLATVGLALGFALAVVVIRQVDARFYGLDRVDPATFVGVAAVMLAVAALAGCIPARQAISVEPMEALRVE